MARRTKKASEPVLNYEAKLCQMADALRNNMDAEEYKHVVLGLSPIPEVPNCPSRRPSL